LPLAPFEKWGIDYVGPIKPAARSSRAQYIILATDYATKWVEAVPTARNDAKTSKKFLFKNIVTRFGCPLEIVSDRGFHFLNETIQELTRIFFIKHRKTTPYNPKANGLTERENGIMVNILNKIIYVHKTDWDIKLQSALWAYRTAEKITTKRTPFYLVYQMDSIMPVEFEVPTYKISTTERLSSEESLSPRLHKIEKLEEDTFFSLDKTYKQQFFRKLRYDNQMKPVKIKEGD
jgi:transposase InsO family protein